MDSKEDPDNGTENQIGSALTTGDDDAPEERAQGSAMQGGIYRLLGTLGPREQMVSFVLHSRSLFVWICVSSLRCGFRAV